MTHLYKIKNKQGQIVTFQPNAIQLNHIFERGSHRYNLITKYRQGGVTTLYAIDLLDEALWVPGMTCGIIAHEAKKLPDYFNIVKRAYANLPEKLKPRTKTDTKYMYEFTHRFDGLPLDSAIYVATDIRGGTVQKLHVTESAYIKDRANLKAGSKQAVPISGSISEETTGNGYNEYYDDFVEAYNKKNSNDMDYRAYFYPWIIDPEYTLPGEVEFKTQTELDIIEIAKEKYNMTITDGQLLWRRWKKNELRKDREGVGLSGDQLFKQEYPLTIQEAFQSGHGNVFDGEKVDMLIPKEPLTKPEVDGLIPQEEYTQMRTEFYALWQLGASIWELPQLGHEYVIGVDPSDGLGADSTCIDVWDKNTLHQAGQYYGKVLPDEVAEITAQLGKFYNKAFVGVENNMLSTILFLTKIYDNYYYTVTVDEKTAKRTKKIGWNTNTKTRDLMIDDFIILFEDGSLTINSPITIKEMKTFVRKDNGKREHADGKNDDALFAGFVAMQMRRFYTQPTRVFAQKPVGF